MDMDEFLEQESKRLEEQARSRAMIKGRLTKEDLKEEKTIDEDIINVKKLLEKSRYQKAAASFLKVKDKYSHLAENQAEERGRLYKELVQLNNQLIDSLNNLRAEFDKKVSIIRDLLTKANQYLNTGNLKTANELYTQIKAIYNQLPDAFEEKKLMLENEIIAFFKKMTDLFNKKTYQELTAKSIQVNKMLDNAFGLVQKGRVDIARGEYNKVSALYESLPLGYIYEKALLYKRILMLYELVEIKSIISEEEGKAEPTLSKPPIK